MSSDSSRAGSVGLLYGLLAYGFWGLVPLYWKLLVHIPAIEILAHRVLWGAVCFFFFVLLRGRFAELVEASRMPRARSVLALSAALLATNWGIFIYAIETDRVLHISLGYFINPLVNILLGFVVLRERLRRSQVIALCLAIAGVALFASRAQTIPWVSFVLAGSFAVYGLLRKTAPVDALPGSTIETFFMLPVALLFLGWLATSDAEPFLSGSLDGKFLIASTGLVTMLPLLWFTNAARRLTLTTLGFVQYLAPSGQFLLAILVFDEPFSPLELLGFTLIWLALLVLTVDSVRVRARVLARWPRPPG